MVNNVFFRSGRVFHIARRRISGIDPDDRVCWGSSSIVFICCNDVEYIIFKSKNWTCSIPTLWSFYWDANSCRTIACLSSLGV